MHRLGIGRYDIGSGPASYIRIDDPELASRALTLSVATDGTCRLDVHGEKAGAGETLTGSARGTGR